MIIVKAVSSFLSVAVAVTVLCIAALCIFMFRAWKGHFTCLQSAIRFFVTDWMEDVGLRDPDEYEEEQRWSNFVNAMAA